MVQTSRWPVSRLPISNIQPFTYRDGETYLSLLNRLAEYITTQLHPNLRKTVEEIVEEMEHILAAQHGKYVEGVQDFQRIHDAFMVDVNSTLMSLNDAAVSDLVNDDMSLLGETLRDTFVLRDDQPLAEDRELITVGDGGHYATLNEALTFISRYNTRYKPEGVSLEVRLLSGFTLAEQVQVNQFDLGHVTITSEDDVVTIHSASINKTDGTGDSNAFSGSNNAVLPVISTMFTFDQSATGPINGIGLQFNSSVVVTPGAGFTDAPNRGMNIQLNSHAALWGADFSRAGEVGIRVGNASSVHCEDVVAKDSKYYGLSASSSHAVAHRGDFSGSRVGVSSQSGSIVSGHDMDVTNCSEYGVEARQASVLSVSRIKADNAGDAGVITKDASYANVLDGSSQNSTCGIRVESASTVNAHGFTVNQSTTGVHVDGGSTLNGENLQANACGIGVSVNNQSRASLPNARINNAETSGVAVHHGSYVNTQYARVNDAGTFGLIATNGSTAASDNMQASRVGTAGVRAQASTISINGGQTQRGQTPDPSDMQVSRGGIIWAYNTTGGSKVANTLDQYGVVFRDTE